MRTITADLVVDLYCLGIYILLSLLLLSWCAPITASEARKAFA